MRQRATNTRLVTEQPEELSDLYLVFLSLKFFPPPKIICGKASTAVLCVVPTVYRRRWIGKDVLTDLAGNNYHAL